MAGRQNEEEEEEEGGKGMHALSKKNSVCMCLGVLYRGEWKSKQVSMNTISSTFWYVACGKRDKKK